MNTGTRSLFGLVLFFSLILSAPANATQSYPESSEKVFAASAQLTWANFHSRLAQSYGSSEDAYSALAYAGWARDALYLVWLWNAPLGSLTEETAGVAWNAAEELNVALYMLWLGDYSYLEQALVAMVDAQYWTAVTAYYAGQRW